MTRRVGEPAQERKARQGVWGVEDVRKRPAPIPPESSGGVVPWIILEAGGQTLGSGLTFSPLLFDGLYWDPLLADDVANDNDPVFSIDVQTHSSIDHFVFSPRVDGWFHFEYYVLIDQTTDGGVGVFWEAVLTPQPSGGAFPRGPIGRAMPWNDDSTSETEFRPEMLQNGWVFSTAQREWNPAVRQNTGVDKSIGGYMIVKYYGGLGGSIDNGTWEFANP